MQSPPLLVAFVLALFGCATSAPPPAETPVGVGDSSPTLAAKQRAIEVAPPSGILSASNGESNAANESQSPSDKEPMRFDTEKDGALDTLKGNEVGNSFGVGSPGVSSRRDDSGPHETIKAGSVGHGNGAAYGWEKKGVVRTGPINTQGSLPSEEIQRVVQRNLDRFRYCYNAGLMLDPSLEGKIAVQFVIGPNGSVESVTDAPMSDLPKKAVTSCILHAFRELHFSSPEVGKTSGVCTLLFQPNTTSKPASPQQGSAGGATKGAPTPSLSKPSSPSKTESPTSL